VSLRRNRLGPPYSLEQALLQGIRRDFGQAGGPTVRASTCRHEIFLEVKPAEPRYPQGTDQEAYRESYRGNSQTNRPHSRIVKWCPKSALPVASTAISCVSLSISACLKAISASRC
jgi:hypothetical protein